MTKKLSKIKATVTASTGKEYVFPEQTSDFMKNSSNSAICFSGGGNRSLSACVGQMRGLQALGVLENACYISCVSGGSWAATAYTFYKTGPANDTELLGEDPSSIDRQKRDLQAWGKSLKKVNLGYPSTVDFRQALLKNLKEGAGNLAWIYAVKEVFFKPYGLDSNHYMADSAESVENILAQNIDLQPEWTAKQFDVPRAGRPYLIINATLLGSVGVDDTTYRVLLQFTPSYTGNPFALTIKEKHILEKTTEFKTGGGVIDSFAFQSTGPNQKAAQWQLMPAPDAPLSVWHASGISSSSYGYSVSSGLKEVAGHHFIPQVEYWPASEVEHSQTVSTQQYMTDGGNLENMGIMPPLQRQVEHIVIFVNSEVAITKDAQGTVILDSQLSALFGVNNADFPKNQVFATKDYQKLQADLWAAHENGGLCMAKGEYETQENTHFGTPAYRVNVLWVYNAAVNNWMNLLHEDVQKVVKEGVQGKGSLAHFPNYKTMDENALMSIHQTTEQTALIADMFSWSIQQQAADFKAFLRSA
jgi:hypothetical protein